MSKKKTIQELKAASKLLIEELQAAQELETIAALKGDRHLRPEEILEATKSFWESDKPFLEWISKKVQFITESLTLDFIKTATIIDIGAGHGMVSDKFHQLGAGVTTIEPNLENATYIRDKYPHLSPIKKDIEVDHFEPRSHDLVLSLGLMYHLEDPLTHLRKCLNMSKKYTIIDTVVSNGVMPDIKVSNTSCHITDGMGLHEIIPSEQGIMSILSHQKEHTYQIIKDPALNQGQIRRYDWEDVSTVYSDRDNSNESHIPYMFIIATRID